MILYLLAAYFSHNILITGWLSYLLKQQHDSVTMFCWSCYNAGQNMHIIFIAQSIERIMFFENSDLQLVHM